MFYSVIAPRTAQALPGYAHYVELLAHAGGQGFAAIVSSTMIDIGLPEFFVCLHRRDGEAPQTVLVGGNDEAHQRAAAYRNRFFRHDPLRRLIGELGDQQILFARVPAAEIPDSGYRRTCFDGPGFAEKLMVVQKVPEGWLVLNLPHACAPDMGEEELQALRELARMLMPIIATHVRLAAPVREQPLSIADIEMRVSTTFPELSQREREVCARTLAGVTAEGIGLDLGIKQTTVLTYRRRAYERLNISTVHQLSTMLIR